MNIYKIERTDFPDYDEYDGVVVVAKSVYQALTLLEGRDGAPAYGDGWQDCETTLVGTAFDDSEPGVILASFRAG